MVSKVALNKLFCQVDNSNNILARANRTKTGNVRLQVKPNLGSLVNDLSSMYRRGSYHNLGIIIQPFAFADIGPFILQPWHVSVMHIPGGSQ